MTYCPLRLSLIYQFHEAIKKITLSNLSFMNATSNKLTIVLMEIPRIDPLTNPTYRFSSKLSKTQQIGASLNKIF